MPAKKSKEVLSHDIAQLVHHHHVKHKTLQQSADLIGVSRETVKLMKRTELYHELAQNALREKKADIDVWIDALIRDKDANKEINVDGDLQEVADNVARANARTDAFKIFGAYAPTKQDVQHSFAGTPDEEVDSRIEEAAKQFNVDAGKQGVGEPDTPTE